MAVCAWLDGYARRCSGQNLHRVLPHAHHVTEALERLLVVLRRYVYPNTSWNRELTTAVFLTCFALACSGTLLFQCTPIAASWSIRVRIMPNTRCFPNRTYSFIGLFNSIINIITDLLFAILPIPVILKLQVNKRTKITLIVVLSLGFIACVAGIIKAHLQVTAIETPDSAFENKFQIWYMLELCLGILAASLPTLKPLFAAVLDGTRSRIGTHSRSRGTAGAQANPSHSSRLRPACGPTSFPDPADGVDLHHYRTGNGAPGTTRVETSSVAASSDLDTRKSPYDARVTGRMTLEDNEQWESFKPTRSGSQERLHHPRSGIFKTVELSHSREVAR
jgi:hypothetical protein